MGPSCSKGALIEKPGLDGRREKCYSGSEQLGNKGGCWLRDMERSGSLEILIISNNYSPFHFSILPNI